MNHNENTTMLQIEKNISEIKTALLGSALSGDEGVIGKLRTLSARQDAQDRKIETLFEEKIRNAVYIKIIIWLTSTIGVGFCGLLISHFFRL